MINLKDRRLWVFGILILLIIAVNQPDEDKKGGFGDITNILLGAGILGIGILMMPFPLVGVPLMIIGGFMMVGGGIGSIVDIFRPKPTIPIGVWIVGFFILALMALRKK